MNLRYRYSWVLLLTFLSCKEKVNKLQVETIALNDTTEVELLEDSLVKPVLYFNVPDLSLLPVQESKAKFIAITLPSV
ncbi:MAG: hypothetical protein RIB63_06815, partial [Fulvivirga sp.]